MVVERESKSLPMVRIGIWSFEPHPLKMSELRRDVFDTASDGIGVKLRRASRGTSASPGSLYKM